MSDYSGPLLADLPNNVWSRSAMVRIAEELALQHHLLAISYYLACQRHYGHAAAEDMYRKQFVGIAGFPRCGSSGRSAWAMAPRRSHTFFRSIRA